ncbi:MAG: TolC family protein [Gemmataceae bacterium]
MRRTILPLLLLSVGCQSLDGDTPSTVERAPPMVQRAPLASAPSQPASGVVPAAANFPAQAPVERLDLPVIWDLALVSNPALREAAADVEAARGRLMQSGLYPNPRFLFTNDTIGSDIARPGNSAFEFTQEIVTAGKRRLDVAVARRETDAAVLGATVRKFDALTRIRRLYFDYLALWFLHREYDEIAASLDRGIEVTRQQVEVAKTRPKTDMIRLEALREEAKINRDRTRDTIRGVWRQLAAEVGLAELPSANEVGTLPPAPPAWEDAAILNRVLAAHSAIRQAEVEVDRARLAIDRAQAGAIPNVIVGGGFNLDRTDQTSGAVVVAETAIPVWNRQQGAVYEAKAKLAFAQASVRSVESRLSKEAAEAIARYRAATRQVERLEAEVLPRLQESVDLTRKAYQAGSAQVTFADVLTTEQNLLTARVTLAEARRTVWQAVADLQGLMQLDVGNEWFGSFPGGPKQPAQEPKRP